MSKKKDSEGIFKGVRQSPTTSSAYLKAFPVTTDPIKQEDELDKILIDVSYMNKHTRLRDRHKRRQDAKAKILDSYIPKQALAAALEDEPKTGDLEDDVYIVPARNELRAELRQHFGLEPKGDQS